MYHGERYTPCPPIPPPSSTVNYFVLCYSFLLGEGNGTQLQYSCLENAVDRGAWWAAVHGVAKSRRRLSDFTFTLHFHALEKEMATHAIVLAWRIPGTRQPGGLPSMGLHRVRHDWSNLAAAAAAAGIVYSLRDSFRKTIKLNQLYCGDGLLHFLLHNRVICVYFISPAIRWNHMNCCFWRSGCQISSFTWFHLD